MFIFHMTLSDYFIINFRSKLLFIDVRKFFFNINSVFLLM